jgi:hypothetical protein
MAQPLFVVEETFTIFGQGIGLLPGVPKYEGGPRVAPGMSIELRRPDGTILATTIRAIEWIQTPPGPAAPLLMPPEISKEEVPAGTEVWLSDALGLVTDSDSGSQS